MNDYKKLKVWEKAMQLVEAVYRLTEEFPREEMYGLTSQMRRAAISIPSNIAEGCRRESPRAFRRFLLDAYGSGGELETQVILAKRLLFAKVPDYVAVDDVLQEVMKMLNSLIASTNYKLQTTNQREV